MDRIETIIFLRSSNKLVPSTLLLLITILTIGHVTVNSAWENKGYSYYYNRVYVLKKKDEFDP